MRLRKDQIENLSKRILNRLQSQSLAQLKTSEEKILEKIQAVITQNLADEQKLETEVDQLLAQFRSQIRSGQINEAELFLKMKKELAKKKKFVL